MKPYRCLVCGKIVADAVGNIVCGEPVAWDMTDDGYPLYAHERCMNDYVPQINYLHEQLNYLLPININ